MLVRNSRLTNRQSGANCDQKLTKNIKFVQVRFYSSRLKLFNIKLYFRYRVDFRFKLLLALQLLILREITVNLF